MKMDKLLDVKLAQYKCQNLSMSKTNPSMVGQPYVYVKN
jgi:hypothetical protein